MKHFKLLALLLSAMLLLCACAQPDAETTPPTESYATATPVLDLGSGLSLLRVSGYAGLYVEDGTDETVSDVCAILVRNDGDKTVQYAHIVLSIAEESYEFDLTTLPAGETAQLLELSRKAMPQSTEEMTPYLTSFAAFETEPSLCADVISVETQDTAITLTNISDADIGGQIYVYYKVQTNGLYIGGITYRVGVSGLNAGESTTCYAGHFVQDSCRVMFVTYVP